LTSLTAERRAQEALARLFAFRGRDNPAAAAVALRPALGDGTIENSVQEVLRRHQQI
jgi:hypothetical protein